MPVSKSTISVVFKEQLNLSYWCREEHTAVSCKRVTATLKYSSLISANVRLIPPRIKGSSISNAIETWMSPVIS